MKMFLELMNHMRLVWRLFWDDRVRWWHRAVFVVPVVYLLVPFRYDLLADLIPVIGLLDDCLLALLTTYLFAVICPRPVVRELRATVLLSSPDRVARERARMDAVTQGMLSAAGRLEMYRHPREGPSAVLAMAVLVGFAALGGMLVGVLLVLYLGVALISVRIIEARLLRAAARVDDETYPRVQACLTRCWARLPRTPVRVYVIDSPQLNAYTLGLDKPYALLLSSRLVQSLDLDELTAVIGHELGHILFEHTFLSSVVGGLLYNWGWIGLAWRLVFFRWRRYAELTADRVSMMACGELDVPVRSLVRLATGDAGGPIDVESIVSQACGKPDRRYGPRTELAQTHPDLLTRIRALVDFDAQLLAQKVERWLAEDDVR